MKHRRTRIAPLQQVSHLVVTKLGSVHLAELDLGSPRTSLNATLPVFDGNEHACARDCVEHVVDAFDSERATFFVSRVPISRATASATTRGAE